MQHLSFLFEVKLLSDVISRHLSLIEMSRSTPAAMEQLYCLRSVIPRDLAYAEVKWYRWISIADNEHKVK